MLLLLAGLLFANAQVPFPWVKFRYPSKNREALVECLWKQQEPMHAEFGDTVCLRSDPRFHSSCTHSEHNGYVDYACGRCIELLFFTDSVTRFESSCTPDETLRECVGQLRLAEWLASGGRAEF